MGKRSVALAVTTRQRAILVGFLRTKKSAQQLVERCRVVLLSAMGRHNESQAEELGIDRQRVRRWRHRWASGMASLQVAETAGAKDLDLEKLILGVLSDAARSGAPAKFSAEQIAGMIALACEPPSDSGLPYFNHVLKKPFRWTYTGRPLQAWVRQADRNFCRGHLV